MTLRLSACLRLGAVAFAALTAVSVQAQTSLSMWYHGAGNPDEKKIITGIIDDFNKSQKDWKVSLQQFPQEAYNTSVVAAAVAGKLPDIMDVDGPIMPNWAWSKYLQPLDLPKGKLDNFLPGTIGKWNGKVYSVGLWDAAVAVFARKSVLEANKIRIPTLDKPWTKAEFDAALVTLQKSGKFQYPIDMGLAWKGEWYSYAFGPFLQSAGGNLLDPAAGKSNGVLNGPAGVAFGEWWKSLFTRKLTPGTSQSGAERDTGFLDGKYALQWNGNWAALPALKKYGKDLVFLPAPDFGKGPKIGAASWQFGVSATTKNAKGANAFIAFALQDKYLAAFSDAIGLIPSTPSAAAMTKNYAKGGPLEVFFELSKRQATLRPVSPGYALASNAFEKALSDIANGGDAADALDSAADAIDADLKKNNGYR
ncbi:sugar ABC transporter substrate-binding protein [Amphibiibacter pelophylacis]|uniref:Extracellular solute-binding protein n=1 Tax=Amphibiibacter pelophylacis TaxID=1799477 RepID=A0ACC6P268_9BURK